MRTGNNIRKRKDGRFEARYEKGRDADGRIVYGYCYGASYEEAEIRREKLAGSKERVRQMNLLILGAGDHGNEVREICRGLRLFQKIGFLDDDVSKTDILGTCSELTDFLAEYPIGIAAVGDSGVRCRLMNSLIRSGFVIPTLIHPSAVVALNAEIGPGTVICAGATVGQHARIGKGCIIDSGAVIERKASVPDWTLIGCGEVVTADKKKEGGIHG